MGRRGRAAPEGEPRRPELPRDSPALSRAVRRRRPLNPRPLWVRSGGRAGPGPLGALGGGAQVSHSPAGGEGEREAASTRGKGRTAHEAGVNETRGPFARGSGTAPAGQWSPTHGPRGLHPRPTGPHPRAGRAQ